MKKIYLTLSSITLALLLSTCGGGDSSSFENSQTLITIPSCETYEDIVTGDTVVQDESNTSIKTVFNTDGTKKVCVLTGSAHIVRQ
jgi:hypothetical protein